MDSLDIPYAKHNSLLATNPDKLSQFLNTIEITKKQNIHVHLHHTLPNIVYTRILKNLTTDAHFETKNVISFENAEYLINCTFIDGNKLHILNDSIHNQISYNLIEKINDSSQIKIEKYKKLVQINDKIFNVILYEKLENNNIKLSEEIFEPKYKFDQIVKFTNGTCIISRNNEEYSLEYTYKLEIDDTKLVAKNINYMIKLLSGNRHRIIQNDIFIDNYKQITHLNSDKILKTVNPINISIEILLDKIDMSHCVFEKTDGERIHVLVYDGCICYFNSIFETYLIGTIKDKTINKLFDAEIYTKEDNNQEIIFIFNILYDNENSNLRDLSLPLKLDKANDFLNKHKINTNIDIKVKTPIYNTTNKQDFFKKIHDLIILKSDIRTDGIIFQSVLSTNKTWEKKIYDYKWKPLHETSLDFLVKIDKNRLKTVDGDFFKLNLYGFISDENGNEVPNKFGESYVLVDPDEKEIGSTCPLTSTTNEIICENSVIEFNPDIDKMTNTISWVPYRVRMDKSLAVFYYKRKQGNSIETCKSTVEYLEMSISEVDFEILGENYEKGYEQLASRLQNKRVVTKRDPIVDRILDFVSTNILTSFARYSSYMNMYDRVDMIDLNCGNGINLFKIYEYAVLMKKNNFFYHGYNENRIQINSTFNGAISRYNKFRSDKTYSNFPICTFTIYNIYQILDNITSKYNHMICLDAYIYQDSKSKIITISKIIRKLMVPKSMIFLVFADKTFTIDDKIYNINCNIETSLSILTSQNITTICESYTFERHLHDLDNIRPIIGSMTNHKTSDFLLKTLSAYDKLRDVSLSNLQFIILYKSN